MSSWPNTITLGGIVLDQDNSASFRVVENLTGWEDAPGIRSGLAAKAQQDGGWDASGFTAERVVEVAGFIEEPTADAAHAVIRQLSALRPQNLYAFTVTSQDTALSAQVRVTVGVKADWIGDQSFTYTLQVTAPDPLKYGAPTFATATLSTATPGAGRVYPLAYPLDYGIAAGVTPGAVAVANAGTAAYWPRLRIDGPVTNPVVSLTESGAWVRYNGALVAGQWLDLDMGARRVLLQGQVSVRQKVSSSGGWLAVPPGGGSISWGADTADPAAKLSVFAYEGSYI